MQHNRDAQLTDNKKDDANDDDDDDNINNNSACPCHEGILKRKGIALLIPNLDARWCCVVNFTSRPCLPQGRDSWNRRLNGPNIQSGCFWRREEDKIILSLTGFETRILVTTETRLSRINNNTDFFYEFADISQTANYWDSTST